MQKYAVWDVWPAFSKPEEEIEYNKFYTARPYQQEKITRLIGQGKVSLADTLKGYLITEYIRQTHSDRAREIVGSNLKNLKNVTLVGEETGGSKNIFTVGV